MSNTQLSRYLDILLEKEFIEEKRENGNGTQYYLTDKGYELLDPLQEVITFLQEH